MLGRSTYSFLKLLEKVVKGRVEAEVKAGEIRNYSLMTRLCFPNVRSLS